MRPRAVRSTDHNNRKGLYATSYIDVRSFGRTMSGEPKFAVTFVFDNAVVTTTVTGPDAVVPRASQQLSNELGIDTDAAQEVQVHEHP